MFDDEYHDWYSDENMLVHLHKEDLLWFITTFKDRKKELIKKVDKILED